MRTPIALSVLLLVTSAAAAQARLRVMFLGDRGHHEPAERMHDVHRAMTSRGIDLFYTDRVADLNGKTLAHYDCVVLYANHPVLPKKNEEALIAFVAGGKGFVPVHCASACFYNSPRFVALVGGQFQRHGTGVFAVETTESDHPAMRGLKGFESWDETYVHTKLTDDRTVLQFRSEKDGRKEPWTWVREQGKGRVFYTAWGHDQRTWSKPGFQNLLERGIRWASGDRFVDKRPPAPKFEYDEADVPHYEPGVSRRDMKNLPTMQKPMSPAESMRRLRVPPEFEVELFAADPKIKKPIAMTWDERGRLWIAETTDYPNNIQKEGEGHDRITICEDKDGDGVADAFKVFADELSIPTSLVRARGGVIVAQAPHFLFLKDTDGDDVADVREVLFTGWSTGDTHAGPSNLRYGFDNQIWGSVGYAGFSGTVGGERHRFRQGFYRFRPDGSKLEFLTSTTNNTWGLGFSEEGFVFGSTANGNPSVYMAIPNRYYEKLSGWSSPALQTIAETLNFHPVTEKVRQVDWHGKYTAAAGHALYTARSFPKRYWNRAAFVAAPTGHLLSQFFLEKKGTHFVARDGFNLLASDDEWTAPIMAEVGPDGAVWVIDWYNYIVQHNPTPRGFKTGKGNAYETPLRDKWHGRIYRIVHRDAKPSSRLDLSSVDAKKLVATLGHDNLFWRLTAQRLLVERRSDGAIPALVACLNDSGVDALGLNPGVQHALWALHGLGALTDVGLATQVSLLGRESSSVRSTAVQLLPMATVSGKAASLLKDADPHVRLRTLLRLADAPNNAVVGRHVFAAMQDAKNLADRWIPDAATAAAAQHAHGFLSAALAEFEVDAPAAMKASINLLPNPSFEEQSGGNPAGWKVRTYGGAASHHHVREGRGGSLCVKIVSDKGADSSWFADIDVEPGARYEFTGWIKTAGAKRHRGGANGALFNAHELQGRNPVKTKGLFGDRDWTRVEVTFDTGGRSKIGINCLFGGWGHCVGTAWFDDVRLVRVSGNTLPGKLGRTISRVMSHYAEGSPVDSVGDLLQSMQKASPGLSRALLDGLVGGWPEKIQAELSPAQLAAMREWLPKLPDESALDLIRLLNRWGHGAAVREQVASLAKRLHVAAAEAEGEVASRVVAVARLVELEPLLPARERVEQLRTVLGRIEPQTPFELAAGILGAVGLSAENELGEIVVGRWNRLTGRVQQSAARVLTRRPAWTVALLDGMVARTVPSAVLTPAEWLQLENHPDATIQAKVAAARSNKPTKFRKAVLEKFMYVAKRRGDAEAGKKIFTTNCIQCHTMGGVGTSRLGPQLDGIGARPKEELLIAILDPNQSVDGNYLMWVVETKGGEFLAGNLAAESRTTIEVLDIENKRHVIKRSDIETMESSKMSLMPPTFEILGEKALIDLLEFLAASKEHKQKGK